MIPVARRRRAPRRRARPRRLRPLRQAGARATTTPTSATSTGWPASLDALDLRDVTLVCQDWGGLIGLRLVAEHPDRFARVVAANTFLPTGDQPAGRRRSSRGSKFSQETPEFPVGKIVARRLHARPSRPRSIAAYDAPFPDESLQGRRAPVPAARADEPRRSRRRRRTAPRGRCLQRFDQAVPDRVQRPGPDHRGADRRLQAAIPGAAGQPHTTIEGGGHFLQEDAGEELAERRGRLHRPDALSPTRIRTPARRR